MAIVVAGPQDLLARVGDPLGTSAWHLVTQEAVDHFAAGTGNRAPIHVDPEFAKRTPLGTTIAFGIQILAMATMLLNDLWELRNVVNGADYGANRVRYPTAVRVGSRVRLHARLADATAVEAQGGAHDPRTRLRGGRGDPPRVRGGDRVRVLVQRAERRRCGRSGQGALTWPMACISTTRRRH
jgi:acyl dehydratase